MLQKKGEGKKNFPASARLHLHLRHFSVAKVDKMDKIPHFICALIFVMRAQNVHFASLSLSFFPLFKTISTFGP
jgi:hypothetical protein